MPLDAVLDKPCHIAVIGSGIAGLSAAWLLARRHRVTIFEKDSWAGGHANTVGVAGPTGIVPVDAGFVVYNEPNYPNFTALLAHLGVESNPSSMSFAVSLPGFEYDAASLKRFSDRGTNILRPRFWTMTRDILRFYRTVPALLDQPAIRGVTLGAYLAAEPYSASFCEDHLLPMSAAIWSTTLARMRDYPLNAFIRFFASHQLLSLGERVTWRSIAGGARRYVERLSADFGPGLRTGLAVRRITRQQGRVLVEDQSGRRHSFDHAVIATHADEALALLDDADEEEQALLGAFGYSTNRTLLHSDPALMPRARRVWSSWNVIGAPKPEPDRALCVTYWMNRLQNLPGPKQYFVTLNPLREPRPELMHREFIYQHPCFDHAALSAQRRLPLLQGRRNTWFCGSYFGYGFHEDALQSGLAVGEDLGGVRRPWNVAGESARIARHALGLAAE